MALDLNALPLGVLSGLRGNAGLAVDDASYDEVLTALSPEQAFDMYCNWHGLVGWGPRLRQALAALQEAEIDTARRG